MIYIRLPDDAKGAQWGIIELQGDLVSQSDNDLHGQFIGDLHYTKQGIPTLIIGHHILTGKEVPLEKPFAVLRRERFDKDGVLCSQGSESQSVDSFQTEYVVQAIVKKKLIFKVRPKPIISNIPKSK